MSKAPSTKPPFSPNALSFLQIAKENAILRNAKCIGTEHLVFAICSSKNRAFNWIYRRYYPDSVNISDEQNEEACSKTRTLIMDHLLALPVYQTRAEQKNDDEPRYSPTMAKDRCCVIC